MDREPITAESLLRDIYEAESALRWFEQKYSLLMAKRWAKMQAELVQARAAS